MTKPLATLLLLAGSAQAGDWCILRKDLDPVVLECLDKTHAVNLVDERLIVTDGTFTYDDTGLTTP